MLEMIKDILFRFFVGAVVYFSLASLGDIKSAYIAGAICVFCHTMKTGNR
jgi:hypothetical protein